MTSCVCESTPAPPCGLCIRETLPFCDADLSEGSDTTQCTDLNDRLKRILDHNETFLFHESLGDIFHNHQEFDPDFNFYSNINLNCRYFTVDEYLNDDQNLQIICLNIRSAAKNLEKLPTMFDNQLERCPIIALTETWFNNYTRSIYQIEGFKGFHTVRANRRGGGVTIFVKSDYMAAPIPELNIIKPCIETVFVQIQSKSLLNNRKLIIGCIYRPPHSDVTNFNTEFISICEALKSKKECIYLCGDINLNLLSAKHNNSIADFVNTLALFEYVPLINKPTHCTDTGTATLLDNIFVKNMVTNYNGGIVLSDISDHFLICSDLQPNTHQETIGRGPLA